MFHKRVRKQRKMKEDGGVTQQQHREVAEVQVRIAAQTGDKYVELVAGAMQYASKGDWRKAGKACREAIALRPDEPHAYMNLGAVLGNSGHYAEAVQRFLEAKERYPVGSERWAGATASAFDKLRQEQCAEVAKPEWWNDEELKALSARVVRAAPNEVPPNMMRAVVLSGAADGAWQMGPRSAAELKEAVVHCERAAALSPAPAVKAQFAHVAAWCRRRAVARP